MKIAQFFVSFSFCQKSCNVIEICPIFVDFHLIKMYYCMKIVKFLFSLLIKFCFFSKKLKNNNFIIKIV